MSGTEEFTHFLTSPAVPILNKDDLSEMGGIISHSIQNNVENMLEQGSGAILIKIENPQIYITKYLPLQIGSYAPTPKLLEKKKCIVNIKTEGVHSNHCFQYSIIHHFHKESFAHKKNLNKYNTLLKESKLDFSMCGTPVTLQEIEKFEKANNLNINIFSMASSKIVNPFRLPTKKRGEVINLLLLRSQGEEEEQTDAYHFTLITNLNRLLNVSSSGFRYTFCEYCLTGFDKNHRGEEKLQEHRSWCNGTLYPASRVIYPSRDRKWVGYNRFEASLYSPLVLFADFEAIQVSPDGSRMRNTENREVLTQHKCSGFSIVPVLDDRIDAVLSSSHYSGPDAMEKFFDDIEEKADQFSEIFDKHCKKEMAKLTSAEWKKHWSSEYCHFCKHHLSYDPPSYVVKPGVGSSVRKYNIAGKTDGFDEKSREQFNDPKQSEPFCERKEGSTDPGAMVRDHCHITGKY